MKLGKTIKKFKSKKGNQVVIRTLQIEDLDNLLKFANGLVDEDTFVMLSGSKLNRAEEQKYLKDSIEKIKQNKKIHLVALVNGVFAGSAEVRRQERRKSHVGEIGIALIPEYRGEGIGTELLETLVDEAKQLKLRLVYMHCFETNSPALHVYEKIGFQRSGVVPGMLSHKNNYIGEVTLYKQLVK